VADDDLHGVRVARAVTGFTIELLTLAFRAAFAASCAPAFWSPFSHGLGSVSARPSARLPVRLRPPRRLSQPPVRSPGALAGAVWWLHQQDGSFLPFGWLGDWAGTYVGLRRHRRAQLQPTEESVSAGAGATTGTARQLAGQPRVPTRGQGLLACVRLGCGAHPATRP
jgi:hypothetical protein